MVIEAKKFEPTPFIEPVENKNSLTLMDHAVLNYMNTTLNRPIPLTELRVACQNTVIYQSQEGTQVNPLDTSLIELLNIGYLRESPAVDMRKFILTAKDKSAKGIPPEERLGSAMVIAVSKQSQTNGRVFSKKSFADLGIHSIEDIQQVISRARIIGMLLDRNPKKYGHIDRIRSLQTLLQLNQIISFDSPETEILVKKIQAVIDNLLLEREK